ncbi:MAG TPA: hypothetical protein VNI60_07200 [Pyrinomonadaceae bacterium]|nr:hypothetical protein [Pyrinomonadaceae bacterium]
MGFYIVFNNISSLYRASRSADFAKGIKTAVVDSVNKAGLDVSKVGQVTVLVKSDGKILLKVDDASDGADSAIDYNKGAVALLSQIPAMSVPKAEQTSLPTIETEVFSQNEVNENFYPMLEKFGISLQYRIDQADIFRSRQELEISESIGKLAKENTEKERAEQDERAERRFQEKQTENIRECLRQKRFDSQSQNKSK